MKTFCKYAFCAITGIFMFTKIAVAEVDFSKKDLELVKEACLAGSSFDFKTEADGSISVRNLEGKGKISISKKDVTTVDLPDSDKRQEFNEIRSCIREYLLKDKKPTPKGPGDLPVGAIAAQCGCWGFAVPGQVGPSKVCASGKEMAYPCSGICPTGGSPWGTRCN